MTEQREQGLRLKLSQSPRHRTGLEARRRTEAEQEELSAKRIYSFWADGKMLYNYLSAEDCQAYLTLVPEGEQRPVVR